MSLEAVVIGAGHAGLAVRSITHSEGRCVVDGVWFIGLLWMRMRRSGIILGAIDDSAHVAGQVVARRDS
jgi:hypothetical protein